MIGNRECDNDDRNYRGCDTVFAFAKKQEHT